ncbi:hypothetical protein [Aquirhabdus sp.]|uniref:hypothetical protein n=1 Tax=Aquirhabdus sp. TaxID=2824160 RepID=UPI00396C3A74
MDITALIVSWVNKAAIKVQFYHDKLWLRLLVVGSGWLIILLLFSRTSDRVVLIGLIWIVEGFFMDALYERMMPSLYIKPWSRKYDINSNKRIVYSVLYNFGVIFICIFIAFFWILKYE